MEPDLFRSETELRPPGLLLKMFVYSGPKPVSLNNLFQGFTILRVMFFLI